MIIHVFDKGVVCVFNTWLSQQPKNISGFNLNERDLCHTRHGVSLFFWKGCYYL